MKKLLLLLLFIPLVSFGQTFDYNDLKNINSEKQFKRFSFENEFVKVEEFSNKYKTPNGNTLSYSELISEYGAEKFAQYLDEDKITIVTDKQERWYTPHGTILTYAQNYNKEKEIAIIWSYYYSKTGRFKFHFYKKNDGSSNDSFDGVLEQVKNKCTFYDFKEDGYGEYKKEYICYTCPGSAFPGKIGFARGAEGDYIETFTNFN